MFCSSDRGSSYGRLFSLFLVQMPHSKSFDVPVLMLVFNRPEPAARVLEKVLSIKPARLYVVADGPRANKPGEAERCAAARRLFDKVPAEVEVIKLFRTENWGCRKSVSDGISWFFNQEEAGIILEDDCLPGDDFFPFCREMLQHYAHDEEVMHVSGNNFLGNYQAEGSYYFSQIPLIWGWASWRRAWQKYNIDMASLDEFLAQYPRCPYGWDEYFYQKYLQQFRKVAAGEIDTWDYQWTFALWRHGGLSITPSVNLVENIGFGAEATHTVSDPAGLAGIPASRLQWPLEHRKAAAYNSNLDNRMLGRFYGSNFAERVLRKLRSKFPGWF